MTEYSKKVSGVTSILIRDAHGKKKIDHDAWNDELRDKEPASNNKKRNYNMKRSIAPASTLYICIAVAWIILFLPIPIINYWIAFPLLLTAFVLAVICVSRNAVKHGIVGFFMLFVLSPIIILISMGTFLSFISGGWDKIAHKGPHKSINTHLEQTSLPRPQDRIVQGQTSNREIEKTQIKYKYLISFKDGRNVVADSFSVSGDIAKYSMGTINVSFNKEEIKSFKKIAMK